MTEWISVGQVLPELIYKDLIYKWSEKVLCLIKFYQIVILSYTDQDRWIDFSTGIFATIENVTHWMPLPQPPKKIKNERKN